MKNASKTDDNIWIFYWVIMLIVPTGFYIGSTRSSPSSGAFSVFPELVAVVWEYTTYTGRLPYQFLLLSPLSTEFLLISIPTILYTIQVRRYCKGTGKRSIALILALVSIFLGLVWGIPQMIRMIEQGFFIYFGPLGIQQITGFVMMKIRKPPPPDMIWIDTEEM